jgi:hypothetical protein
MQRFFWRLDELRRVLWTAYPAMSQVPWIDSALKELWEKGTPSPGSWDYRMIAPSAWAKFAHEVGQRIGQEVRIRPSG